MQKFLYLFLVVFILHATQAHPGRLAQDGCHNERRTGKRHCHRGLSKNKRGGSTNDNSQYNRKDYVHWIDADYDGQNTRQEVLIEENIGTLVLSADNKKVLSGKWYDPYTNKIFTDPRELDIDHFVPLKEAHISGAYLWDSAKKQRYANYLRDPTHLIAVSKSANRSKGARDPWGYLPPNTQYICTYLAVWVSIKDHWKLAIDKQEKQAIERAKKKHRCK